MMKPYMPAESDLPVRCIKWQTGWISPCVAYLCSPAAEFACGKWRIYDFEVHPFCSLEDDKISALSPVTGGDAENITLSYRYLVLAVSRRKRIHHGLRVHTKPWQRALLSPSPHLLTSTPSPHVVRLSRHAYAAARSGNATTDLPRRRAHLHLTTWDCNQESACIMSLDSAVRRCNRRPIEVCCAANLAQDELRCRT
jgi:hypothetical protein